MNRSREAAHDDSPIGVFDSGYGGLTVLREIVKRIPGESFIFLGDSARCPYGPRDLEEVESFTLQICSYLVGRGCKLIVIACNTATAAGLKSAQQLFDIPIIGVVEPGARAATQITKARRVGVIATEATISSGAYEKAITHLDPGIKVFPHATPQFVNIAEEALQIKEQNAAKSTKDPNGFIWDQYSDLAKDYLEPLNNAHIDTLVLGCTHFPLIEPLISRFINEDVKLVSSAEETARDVSIMLERRNALACASSVPKHEYLTTASNEKEFADFGTLVLQEKIHEVKRISLPDFGIEGNKARHSI